MVINNSNTVQRLRNIALSNGSFQERLVFYEDTISAIIKNPAGYGINMFQYKCYENASAFYDVKYVHNSLLQTTYDIGVIGGVIFLGIIIYGLLLICKNKTNNRYLFIGMYSTIFIHSLLDFDFSYSTFGILLTLIIVMNYKNKKEVVLNKNIGIIYSIILICVIYLGVFESTLSIGKILAINNKVEASNDLYNLGKKISMGKDARPLFYKASGLKDIYDETGDIKLLESDLDELKESNKINEHDPRIVWNMAYIYEKKGCVEETINLKDEILIKQRYYKESYTSYKSYLEGLYEVSNEDKYKEIIQEIESYYNESLIILNPRAKYMKNQIKKDELEGDFKL